MTLLLYLEGFVDQKSGSFYLFDMSLFGGDLGMVWTWFGEKF